MPCELNCSLCPINIKRGCSLWYLDAGSAGKGNSLTTGKVIIEHSQTGAQLRTKLDAKSAARNLKGASGGVYGGVPAGIEVPAELYATDQLKAERNAKS